jgi:spoIIIJ-associated protein
MSDRVFSGRDVAEALGMAGQALGLRPELLRYVVLDAGTAGGLGLRPTPARVAVLLAGAKGANPGPPARPTTNEPPPTTPASAEAPTEMLAGREAPGLAVERVVAALAQAAQVDIHARSTQSAEVVSIEVGGSDVATFLLGPQGAGVPEALEHLLHGMFAPRVHPRRLRVEYVGQREQREAKLRMKALELAAAVLNDGQPRTTDALNAYERRLVHMAVAERRGVITYSVGGGADRRVTVAPEQASLGGEVY